ncbi:MAG: glycosyltransferase family 2 protein [Sphingobacteriaceae bacterium]|nr:MAG: glycosyltransferase family 2 protein [Sphingobacteriaceae bacterium]
MIVSNQALVTIITPCYNYGKFLAEALDSLLLQTYQTWECIIINDGSKDNTEEIGLKYAKLDSRIKYHYQNNTGLAGARNNALRIAKGKYIQLLDADDLIQSDKLRLQVELIESNPSIDLIYSSMKLFKSNAKARVYENFYLPNNITPSGKDEIIINALLEDTFFLPGCVFFKKELYEKTGNFNESLYGLEDWNYWSRAALLGFEFYSDQRDNTKLLCRDHDANMSKVYEKMLKSRVQARTHIIQVTENLNLQKKLTVSNSFINSILKKHHLLLLLDKYQYYFHYGNKLAGLKALFAYSIQSGKPFYIFKKLLSKFR